MPIGTKTMKCHLDYEEHGGILEITHQISANEGFLLQRYVMSSHVGGVPVCFRIRNLQLLEEY